MSRHGWVLGLMLATASAAIGFGLLTAQESVIPKQRVNPKVLKEALAEHKVVAAVAPHTLGRSLQDLRTLADELDTAGYKTESARLKGTIRDLLRRAEAELTEKKAQVARLNAEIEDLKATLGQ